jgi:lysophospholipid acyltransferase (LPLAT)-like uncharacterized protein
MAAYLRLALRTTRWRVDGPADALSGLVREPVILAFWHERLLLMPIVGIHVARAVAPDPLPKVNVLVSRHHDGALIARVMAHFKVEAVHGSSNGQKSGRVTERGGAAALRRLTAKLGAGELVMVTPDGPRGPARRAKRGLTGLAAMTGRPIVPCAVSVWPRLRLPTWDRMIVPLPFARGTIAVGAPFPASRDDTACLEQALDEMLARADRR